MDYWSSGVMEYWGNQNSHHSNTPLLQHFNAPNRLP
jgi:hypothetical protein